VGQRFAGERPKKGIATRIGSWDRVDRMSEKVETLRAIADVLSVVDTSGLSPDTIRTLGMVMLAEAQALADMVRGARRDTR
jgi:hypothetical protein